MDVLGTLPVRFHFNGEFITSQKSLYYCGGREEMSYIDRDKVSLPEICGHLNDHCNVHEGALLHWLYPGKELVNGLRVLVNDQSCIEMANTIVEGGVAEIYVEAPEVECDVYQEDQSQMTPSKVSAIVQSREDIVKEWNSPTKVMKQRAVPDASSQPSAIVTGDNNQTEAQPDVEVIDSSDSDSDYLLGDEASSGEDDEATEILKKFKQFKKNLKAGEPTNLDDVVLENPKEVGNMYELEDDGNATSYEDSSDDEDSVEELSDGQVVTKSRGYPRYNKKEASPKFELGMKFSGKKQFKKAVTKHGLVERRFIRFIKNEADRCIAKCDWVTCQWRIMASVNSRCSSWQMLRKTEDAFLCFCVNFIFSICVFVKPDMWLLSTVCEL